MRVGYLTLHTPSPTHFASAKDIGFVPAHARLRTAVTKLTPCWCCKGPLEPAQQLRFLVETDTLNDPAHLERIRVLPSINGRPIPVCKACQARLGAARPPVAAKPKFQGLLGTLGAAAVGLLLTNLFAPRG